MSIKVLYFIKIIVNLLFQKMSAAILLFRTRPKGPSHHGSSPNHTKHKPSLINGHRIHALCSVSTSSIPSHNYTARPLKNVVICNGPP